MNSTASSKGPEQQGSVFFGLITIVTAIAIETLVTRVADLVRTEGWTLELVLMAMAAGLGFAYVWIGYSAHPMALEVDLPGKDMVALLLFAVISFSIVQLIDTEASAWLLGLGALGSISGLLQDARTTERILRAPRAVQVRLSGTQWVNKVGMITAGAFYAVATFARLRGGGEVAAPLALGVAACCWSVMIPWQIHLWDLIRTDMERDA